MPVKAGPLYINPPVRALRAYKRRFSSFRAEGRDLRVGHQAVKDFCHIACILRFLGLKADGRIGKAKGHSGTPVLSRTLDAQAAPLGFRQITAEAKPQACAAMLSGQAAIGLRLEAATATSAARR